jgi:murein DD-endopeptidase MepM/ murein hydrolase activator NlpD
MAAPAAGGAAAAGAYSGTSAGGAILGPQLPAGGGDDEGDGRSWGWLVAGCAAALAVLLLFIAVPAVLITRQNDCSTGTVANGIADPIDLDALTIATKIYDVSREMRMSERQLLSAYITVLVESGGGVTMRNPPDGDRTSVGAFQQQDLPEWTHDGRNRLNVSDAARSYFEAVRKYDAPGISPGELAIRVQRMDARYAGRYLAAEVLARAREFLAQVESGRGATARVATLQVAAMAARALARRAPVTGARSARATGEPEVTLGWPTEVHVITSPFGVRSSPCAGCSSFHEGVDIGAPEGAPVHAAAAGTIALRGQVSGYGNYLCIRHKPNLATCYAHMSRYGRYQQGQVVSEGDVIGYVGHTGVGTGAHLHFEVRLSSGAADPAVDPVPFLDGAAAAGGSTDAMAATSSCGDDASGLAESDAPIAPGPVAVLNGKVLSAPSSAPEAVKRMIAAGNALQALPYTYGGGHNAGYRPSPGFDCSATVSYVLWKAGLLNGFPLDSSALARWGAPGKGAWVTIYANAGHTFIYIAGQRLDTSPHGSPQTENGPRWRGPAPRGDESSRFTAVHPPGL